MAVPLWLHACTVWYIGSNALMAYRSWAALPTFFSLCYTVGLFGGLGDHLEPWVPVECHWITHFMEDYVAKFPLGFSLVAVLLRFCTLPSLPAAQKLRTLALMAIPLTVLALHHPVDYNTDLTWHITHSVVVHGCLLASNTQIFDAITREKQSQGLRKSQ